MRAKQLIVVGHGAAGLAAALSAAEQARRQHVSADIVLLDKAHRIALKSAGGKNDSIRIQRRFGPRAGTLRLISPGTRFDSGDGIRMAVGLGAVTSGDWNGMHIEPVDPRSRQSAPVVLVYPYGIVVDQDGKRFFDEGAGIVHETWEGFARDIHFVRPNSTAYAILDSRLHDIDGFERAIRSELPPHSADTI